MLRALEQRDWEAPPDLYALFVEPREDTGGWAVTAERLISEQGAWVLSVLASEIGTRGAAWADLAPYREDSTFAGIMYLEDSRLPAPGSAAGRRITVAHQPRDQEARHAVTVLRDGTILSVAQLREDLKASRDTSAGTAIAGPLAEIMRAITGDQQK